MATPLPLNAGQQAAADSFFNFLFDDDEDELIISGPAGTGKTYLMGHMIDAVLPQYYDTCKIMGIAPEYDSVVMTATTNKAAEVLGRATGRPAQTIHSFLSLTVKDDYRTGKSELKKTASWVMHSRKIIFVDECSVMDTPLLHCLREGTHKCKVVFVGDHCQLPPVMESVAPIYAQQIPFYELTEPMRNSGFPELKAICTQLRQTVETGIFEPIKAAPGVIDYLSADEFENEIFAKFQQQKPESRILAYTNNMVVTYNDFIRNIRNLPLPYTLNEILVNNSAVRLNSAMLSVEEEVKITFVSPSIEVELLEDGTELEVYRCDLQSGLDKLYPGVKLPADKNYFAKLCDYYAKQKAWGKYFALKNFYPDLRPRDSSTVHKSQGSTYDTVYVDLENISTCRNPNLVARMLYVAFSRATTRIVMYGTLPSKFGGVIS